MQTQIEWTHWPGYKGVTLNPIVGCSRISEGCDHCYALGMARRLGSNPNPAVRQAYEGLTTRGAYGQLYWSGEVRFRPEVLEVPAHWCKPRCIFWCSMSDLFHPDVKVEWLDEILQAMIVHPQHRHIVLTKRPARMFDAIGGFAITHFYCDRTAWLDATKHILWGITAETQERLDERWHWLAPTPVARKFVSLEPLLGPVDLRGTLHALAWVIVGGETGPGARPMDPKWVRSIRDQCKLANVPFFFKQWGEWLEWDFHSWCPGDFERHVFADGDEGLFVSRVGRKLAGCVLDGREHKEFPEDDKSCAG